MGFPPLPLSQLLPAIARVIIVVHTGLGDLMAIHLDTEDQEECTLRLSVGLRELFGKDIVINPLQFDLNGESITVRLTVPTTGHNELTVPKLAVRAIYSEFEVMLRKVLERAFDVPFEVRLCLTYFH